MSVLSRWRRRAQPVPAGSVLDRADALIRVGRGLEAIALVNAETRRRPAALLEAQLVRLRHRAFAELDRAAGPHTLAAVADNFPGVHDVPPEIPASELDAATLRGAIQHHGSLLVRELVAPPVVARLKDDIDRAFAAREGSMPADEGASWYEPFVDDGIDVRTLDFDRTVGRSQGGVLAADSPRTFFDLVESYREVGIGELLADYFGEQPTLSARKTTLRRAHASDFFEALDDRGVDSGWHQDGAFLGAEVRTMNMWLALSECGRDAPSLDLVARRVGEILPTGTEGAVFDWAASSSVVESVGAGAIVRPDFAPGDAIFFDGFCVHQTGAAPTMTQVRYAIESWFFAPSTYPLEWIPLVF